MAYFMSRLFSLTEPQLKDHPQLKDPALFKAYMSEKFPALLKAYISENLRQKFDASRVADRERANTVAQFNRLCDVLEKM
jgi:hypothetical protein